MGALQAHLSGHQHEGDDAIAAEEGGKRLAITKGGQLPEGTSVDEAFDAGVDATLEAISSLLNRLQMPTLRQALTDLGLPTHGEKPELSERITNALQPA